MLVGATKNFEGDIGQKKHPLILPMPLPANWTWRGSSKISDPNDRFDIGPLPNIVAHTLSRQVKNDNR